MNRLVYIEMKIARAQVHLDALNRELAIYLQDAYTVIRKDDIENARHICRTQQNPIPPIIGMSLGEFLYCLRSGLDQAAWQLALPDAKRDFPRDICFPIVEEKSKRLTTILSYFPDAVAKEIELLQPYHGPGVPQEHALWQLNLLCNFDKHKVIPLASTSFPIFVPVNPAVLVKDFEDAIEVSVPLSNKKDLDFQPQVSPEVEFGGWLSDIRIPRHRLADVHGFMRCSVVPKLARFFPDSPETPLSRADLVGPVYES